MISNFERKGKKVSIFCKQWEPPLMIDIYQCDPSMEDATSCTLDMQALPLLLHCLVNKECHGGGRCDFVIVKQHD